MKRRFSLALAIVLALPSLLCVDALAFKGLRRARTHTARPLMPKARIDLVHVMGTQVKNGQVTVKARVFSDSDNRGNQNRAEKTFTLKPGQEVLVGAGAKDGDQVFIRADRLGRTTLRYFTKGWD